MINQNKDVTVQTGETVFFTVEVSGGQAPYTYRWEGLNGKNWSMLRESEFHKGQGSDTIFCIPRAVGTNKYRCVVTDSAGNTVTSEILSVTVMPLTVQINNGEAKIEIDHSINETKLLTANVSGGVGPYIYTWSRYEYNWNTKTYEWIKVSSTSSYNADTSITSDYYVKVDVADSTGTTVTAEILIDVTGVVN